MWILMLGILGAELGMWLGLIGNLEFLQSNVKSSFIQSLILIIGSIAGLLSGPLVGNIIDVLNKKLVLIIAGLIRLIGVLFMLLAIGTESILWMLISMLSIGIASSFYFPGIQAIVPLIIKNDDDLMEANVLQMNIMTLARIIGTALAGVLLLIISLKQVYIYSFIGYLILLLSTFFLNFEEEKRRHEKGYSKEKGKFRIIFPVIKSKPEVFRTLILSIIPFVFISGFNLIVIEISNIQQNPAIKGLLYTVEGLSIIVTGFLVKYLVKSRNIMNSIILSCVLILISQLSLFFSSVKFIPFMSFFIFGVSCGLFMPLSATLYQKQISKEFHGRFFSFNRVFQTGLGQISLLLIGAGLDGLGLPVMMLVLGMISFIVVIYVTTVIPLKHKKIDQVIS